MVDTIARWFTVVILVLFVSPSAEAGSRRSIGTFKVSRERVEQGWPLPTAAISADLAEQMAVLFRVEDPTDFVVFTTRIIFLDNGRICTAESGRFSICVDRGRLGEVSSVGDDFVSTTTSKSPEEIMLDRLRLMRTMSGFSVLLPPIDRPPTISAPPDPQPTTGR